MLFRKKRRAAEADGTILNSEHREGQLREVGRKRVVSAVTIALAVCAGAYVVGEVCNAQVFAKEDYGGIIRFHVKANSDSDEDQALKLKVRDGVLEAVNEMILEETILSYTAEDYDRFVEHEAMKAMQVAATSRESAPDNYESENAVTSTAVAATVEESGAMEVADVQLDMSEMRTLIMDNLEEIEAIAAQIIAENGYEYDVTATLGVSRIPRKTYGDVTFPAGNYEALTIQIGEAKGENWWCVLFPPLCIIDPEGESLAGIETDSIRGDASSDIVDADTQNATHTSQVITLKFKTQEVLEHFGVI